MPFIYRNLVLSPSETEEQLPRIVAGNLRIAAGMLQNFRIIRKGIDARRKPRVKLIYTVSFSVDKETAHLLHALAESDPALEWQEEPQPKTFAALSSNQKIVIAGIGPAGLFCALRLAEYGLSATIVERGQPVEQRTLDVQRFWKSGQLDPESNVQFGEGGAGTFSDGKLTCRSKDPNVPWVLERLADFGAPPEIRYLAKPHIGTDRLRRVVAASREYLQARGFRFLFGSRLTDIAVCNDRVASVIINGSDEIACDRLILATGHSARDTYEMLERLKVPMERKPFAMGLRVEHAQELIDRIQYGEQRHPHLPPADYALTWNCGTTGRSAYSFCMCPGGVVIAGASETGGCVTNGMSGQLRNAPFANSALVVNVTVDDFGATDPLAGVRFQRHWEQQAFMAGGGNYRAPAQNLLDFIRQPGKKTVSSTYRPGITETELETALPPFVTLALRKAIPDFGKKMKGFVTSEATLIGIESRTSAPLRILRDEHHQSIGLKGLFPAGEGAGYAGGIMSSAVDGIRIADGIAEQISLKTVEF